MITEYYKLPLQLSQMRKKKEPKKCTLYESVAAMIHLISVTYFGECKHDESFGCEIWEHDFENIINSQLYKDHLRDSIKQTIETHELRLTNIRVKIQIELVDFKARTRRAKSRINLEVYGTLALTNEPFSFTDKFYIGPLSYY